MRHPPSTLTTDDLLQRIRSEYLEMPGLSLTREQAQRFLGLDADTCTSLLHELMARRFLIRTPAGRYVRLTEWNASPRPLRAGEVAPVRHYRKTAVGE